MQGLIGLVTFLVILGLMVLIHEFGHFAVAKLCGVRIDAFAIGFGKRLFGVVHNGTDYRVNLLPLGGYVKMAGQDEMPSSLEASTTGGVPTGLEPYNAEAEKLLGGDDEDAILARAREGGKPVAHGVEFTAIPRWQRMLVGFAGPFANFILAFVVLLGIGLFHYPSAEFLRNAPVLDYVPQNSSASVAGLQPGDTILSLNDQSTANWQDLVEQAGVNLRQTVPVTYSRNGAEHTTSLYLAPVEDEAGLTQTIGLIPREQTEPLKVHEVRADSPASKAGLKAGDAIVAVDGKQFHSVPPLASYLTDQDGKPAIVSVLRQSKPVELHITPLQANVVNGRKVFQFGFQPEQGAFTIVHLPFGQALKESWKDNVHNSLLIVQVLKGLFTRHVSVKNMSGPVGIEQQVSDAAKQGFWPVAELTAAISLNLGIFNLLPMPILDGGLILFLLIESIARRDVNPAVKEKVYQAAFVCILLFFAFVMWNDISRLSWFAHRPS